MRLLIIPLVVAAVGCNLYYGSDEEAAKHKPTAPDASVIFDAGTDTGSGSGSCHIDGGFLPDAQLLPDGGYGLPDAPYQPDGGYGGLPDAALLPDGGYH